MKDRRRQAKSAPQRQVSSTQQEIPVLPLSSTAHAVARCSRAAMPTAAAAVCSPRRDPMMPVTFVPRCQRYAAPASAARRDVHVR